MRVCVCVGGGWLLTSTIVFLISALGNIFLRTVDPPCGAFFGGEMCVCACMDVWFSACACVYSMCVCLSMFSFCGFSFFCAETLQKLYFLYCRGQLYLFMTFIHPHTPSVTS